MFKNLFYDLRPKVEQLLLVLCCFLITLTSFAQDRITVRGRVLAADQTPLNGVTVKTRGSSGGTTTDANGAFTITVSKGALLVFSFVGYDNKEIKAEDAGQALNIQLTAKNSTLDDVVVIGYGTVKRKDFTGSVSSVKLEGSPLALLPNLNALEALRGNVAGLNVGAVNTAGGEPSIQVRGQNSIKGTNSPLIVVDGVIYLGSISDINPNDIATYDILKDAVSSAAYGSRSANGVIAITLKKGRSQKTNITFNASTAFQNWQNKPDIQHAAQWIELVNASNSYVPGSTYWLKPQEVANMNAGKETRWLDKVTGTGAVQNYQVAVSGASNGTNYYLSAGWDDNKGIVKNDKFNRISVLAKISTTVNKWMQLGVDGSFSKRDYSGVTPNIHTAAIMSPYGVMYRDSLGDYEKYPAEQGLSFVNPLWGIDDGTRDNSDIRQNYRLNSYVLLTAPWIKGLTYRLNFQNNLYTQQTGDFFHESYYVAEGAVTNPTRYAPATIQNYLASANGSLNTNSTYNYVLDNILNYNQSFSKHSIDVTAVATRDYSKYRAKNMSGTNYAANGNTSLGFWGLHLSTTPKVTLDANERANIGYLGRFNYSYDNKYFVTGSFRRDGASVFGENQKWGNFGAAGLAWRVTGEEFLKSFKALNSLKLKASWGQNGNQGVSPYGTLARVTNGLSSGVRYEFSNTGSTINYGLIQNNIANSNLGWESTEKWNAGFESVWAHNRIYVDLDFYTSKTTSEIYTPTIPSMTGFSSIISSLGEVHNKGFELTLRTVNITNRDFTWGTSITYWLNRNKLVHIDGQDLNGDGIEDNKIADGMFIGKPLNSIYGYVQDGIVQPEDVAYKAMPGAATIDGYPKYKDINNDKQITADDRQILGYPQENFRLNMSNTVTYKNWDLYVMVTGIFGGGNYYMKSNTQAYMSTTGDGFNTNMTYRSYWTTTNHSNVYPAAFFKGDGSKFLGLQSRSFVRVQNISLSYSINKDWLTRHKLNTVKLFATANNPFISTKWIGGDPEIGSALLSTDSPVASTYSFGVNLNF